MSTFTLHPNRHLLCLLITACCAAPQIAQAQITQHHDDQGVGSPILPFLGAIQDVDQQLGVNATLADWTALELRIAMKARTGLVSSDQAAAQLVALGEVYYSASRLEDAKRAFQQAVEYAPESYAAARAWQKLGWLAFSPGRNAGAAVRPFQEADRVLKGFLDDPSLNAGRTRNELLRERAIVLKTLGDWYRYSKQDDKAQETYKAVVSSDELSAHLPPHLLLNANRELLRAAARNDDIAAVDFYSAEVGKILSSGKLPSDMVLIYTVENIRLTYADPDHPDRIKALLQLWTNPKFSGMRAILDIGDELTCHYFFSEPMKREEFHRISAELFRRMKPHLDAETDRSLFTPLDLINVRNILMATEYHRVSGNEKGRKEFVDSFETQYKGRDIRIAVSGRRSNAALGRLLAIYEANMVKHAAAARKAAEQREAEPTPAGL